MTTENDEYLKIMEDFIGHPGWKILVSDALRRIEELKDDNMDYRSAKTWDDVLVNRGRAYQLNELILLPELLATIRSQSAEV